MIVFRRSVAQALGGPVLAGPVLAGLAGAVLSDVAIAEVRAEFIVGTYAMEGRCEMLAKLEAGGPRNVATVPETLDADGFHTWEGGCTFVAIRETEQGHEWVATMSCAEGAEEWGETDTFLLDPSNGRITVVADDTTVEDQRSTYVRCDGAKGN